MDCVLSGRLTGNKLFIACVCYCGVFSRANKLSLSLSLCPANCRSEVSRQNSAYCRMLATSTAADEIGCLLAVSMKTLDISPGKTEAWKRTSSVERSRCLTVVVEGLKLKMSRKDNITWT